VDCDKLGHAAYQPGSPTLQKLVAEFGSTVLSEDGTVNRKVLGGIVFSDKSKLTRLNQIVWPEIIRMAAEQADQLFKSGHKVVILDAAVLLEAGWDQSCHEVWVCTVPRESAIQRIIERDHKTREEAENRIGSQMSNQDRVKVANTVFCTLWDPATTQKQVETAWARLSKELKL
jgi:phosphopantetheine adenylyltransferase/dephospho-CoA kinase